MPPPGTGRCPCCHGTEQQCGREGECQDDGAPTRLRERCFRCGNAGVNAAFGICGRKSRGGPHQLNEISPVVGGHIVMAGRREKNPTNFCSLRSHIHIGGSADRPEKSVQFIT
jgi:hypothetical protein